MHAMAKPFQKPDVEKITDHCMIPGSDSARFPPDRTHGTETAQARLGPMPSSQNDGGAKKTSPQRTTKHGREAAALGPEIRGLPLIQARGNQLI